MGHNFLWRRHRKIIWKQMIWAIGSTRKLGKVYLFLPSYDSSKVPTILTIMVGERIIVPPNCFSAEVHLLQNYINICTMSSLNLYMKGIHIERNCSSQNEKVWWFNITPSCVTVKWKKMQIPSLNFIGAHRCRFWLLFLAILNHSLPHSETQICNYSITY